MRRTEEIDVNLRDGTRLVVRPIRPDDKQRLQDGLALLSPMSRFLRFHMPVERLSDEQLAYLTEIDYDNHMAWVATDPARPDLPGVGVARYVRLPDDVHVAEAAVTVIDEYQGRGLGTVLVGILAVYARDHGITTFRNYVLVENEHVLDWMRDIGATWDRRSADVYQVEVPLPEDPDDLPDTAVGRLLKAAARTESPPFLLGLLGVGRRRIDVREDAVAALKPHDGERGELSKWLDERFGDDDPSGSGGS